MCQITSAVGIHHYGHKTAGLSYNAPYSIPSSNITGVIYIQQTHDIAMVEAHDTTCISIVMMQSAVIAAIHDNQTFHSVALGSPNDASRFVAGISDVSMVVTITNNVLVIGTCKNRVWFEFADHSSNLRNAAATVAVAVNITVILAMSQISPTQKTHHATTKYHGTCIGAIHAVVNVKRNAAANHSACPFTTMHLVPTDTMVNFTITE